MYMCSLCLPTSSWYSLWLPTSTSHNLWPPISAWYLFEVPTVMFNIELPISIYKFSFWGLEEFFRILSFPMNIMSPLVWANHKMYWRDTYTMSMLIYWWFEDGGLLPPEDEQKKAIPLLPGKSAELNLNETKEPQNQQYEVRKYLWLVTCKQKCCCFTWTISN